MKNLVCPLLFFVSLVSIGCTQLIEIIKSPKNKSINYTTAQAARGKKIYLDHCALCHGTNLSNGQFGAPLKGTYFRSRWDGRTLAELFTITFATMPPEGPMSLPRQDYADVTAFILQGNSVMAGVDELSADADAQQGIINF